MTPVELVTFFRTQAASARALGCAQSTIAEWVSDGAIPESRQYQVQLATRGQLKADKPALRVKPRRTTNQPKEVSHG